MHTRVKKHPKDVNSANQTRFLMLTVRFTPVLALLGWFIAGVTGLLWALPASMMGAFAVELLSGGLGNSSVNVIYGMGRVDRTLRDQFDATLSEARFHKMSKRRDLALECVDEILAADPNFPEALFVKAQILWEGYQDACAAKNCLMHLMQVDPAGEATFHRWALSLYREIATYERTQNELEINHGALG